jgi:predicted small lipoprotein YifL
MSKNRGAIVHRLVAAAILTALVAVAACGKKGDPVLPDGKKDDFPHQYPQSTSPQTGVFSN